jgi:hypothetical protein
MEASGEGSGKREFLEEGSGKKEFLDSFERGRAARFKEVIKREPIVKQKKEEASRKEAEKGLKETSEKTRVERLTEFIKKNLDLTYVNKIVNELKGNAGNYADRDELMEDYKKLTLYVVRNMEG